jgi:hypothetical protein
MDTRVWIGFLVNSPAGRSSGYGGISLFDDQRQELFLGDTGASNVWAFERSRQLQRFSDVEATDEACFLVYRIRFLPGNERIDMWVNPTPGDEPSESEVAASESAVRDFRFNRVRLCAAPVPMSFDALRIGTTYRDVAPPAANISIVWLVIVQAILLLSLGALTLMLWKQKRRPPIVSTEKLATE